MRPKKKIMLLDADALKLSVRRFLLENKGYRVMACATPAEVLGVLKAAAAFSMDGLVARFSERDDADAFLRAVRHLDGRLPILLLAGPELLPAYAMATRVLSERAISSAELVEAVRLLVARKRGPRPAAVTDATGRERVA